MAKRMPDPAPDPDETDTDTDETNGETDETTEPAPETKPPAVETKPKAPVTGNRIGLDDDPANRVYIDNPSTSGGLEQRVSVGGTYYEHSGQDAEGAWLYRQVK